MPVFGIGYLGTCCCWNSGLDSCGSQCEKWELCKDSCLFVLLGNMRYELRSIEGLLSRTV